MKSFCCIMVMTIFVSISGICQKKSEPGAKTRKNAIKRTEIQQCSENPDALYSRQKVLEQLAEILNISVFGANKDDYEFRVENERPQKFTIYDLTDTSNIGTSLDDCIKLINNHVYHFSPIRKRYSYSHIVILEDGAIKVFKSINCKGKGDSLEDVLNYLNQKLKDNNEKQRILSRVKNYRKYGIYLTVDAPYLECKESN